VFNQSSEIFSAGEILICHILSGFSNGKMKIMKTGSFKRMPKMRKMISYTLVLTLIVSFSAGSAQAKLVACIGDSITYGANISDRVYNSYPAQLGRMLKEFDNRWETQNFGVSGATLLRNGDLPYIQQSAYTPALASNPDVVVIMLGTNDSKSLNWVHKDEFIPDYLDLIDSFARLPGNPEIWICRPVPAFTEGFGISGTIILNEVIPLIDQIAQQRDVRVIDLYAPLNGKSDLFPDGIHPNAEGAGIMAETIFYAIIGIRTLPDFNGDAIVNFRDFTILAQHWLGNEPSLDISPTPDGDGVVNYMDLAGLAQYWLKEIGLVAHWKLDEAEGNIAHDSAKGNDGTVYGDPIWQPEGGKVNGALQLDGIDDYIGTPFVLNPTDGPFSVFAWIKGGAPGQGVISQKGSINWLCTDPLEGKLMTELMYPGRSGASMISETVVTKDDWQRIGFVWDGSYRILYVGNTVAAQEPQSYIGGSENDMYIGTGKRLEPGTFFSGLIDDVRIYNRAVIP
jgi:acyl-CoA thioesterase-1